jgi:hypothetical protein
LDVLSYGLSAVLRFLYVVSATLVVAFLTPFFWLAKWLMGEEVVAPEAPPMSSARPPVPPPPTGGPAWLDLVRAAFFWVVIVGLAVYLVRAFLREHPEIRRALASLDPLGWLARLWKALRARLAAWQAVARTRRRGRGAQGQEDDAGDGAARVRDRVPGSNRGRVLYTYRELLRRARRAGVPRGRAQTPRVYGVRLKQEWPESCDQVDLLTDAFVEARYSRHRIGAEVVRRVQASWQQFRQFMRRQT